MSELPRYTQQTISNMPQFSTDTGVMASAENFGGSIGRSFQRVESAVSEASDVFEHIAQKTG